MRTHGYIFYVDKILLPVSPASVDVSHKNMNEVIKLINDAEFNLLKNLKKRATPVQLIIIRNYPNSGRAYFNTNLKVSLEDIKIEENAEEGMDVYVDVTFKEFIDPRPKVYKKNTDGTVSAENQRWTDKIEKKICSTKYGEKLWQIVRRETGGLDQLETVMEVNGISAVTNALSDKLRLW